MGTHSHACEQRIGIGKGLVANGHRDALPRRPNCRSPAQSLGCIHRDGANRIVTDVLLRFENELASWPVYLKGIQNVGKRYARGEGDVHHRSDYLGNDALRCHEVFENSAQKYTKISYPHHLPLSE